MAHKAKHKAAVGMLLVVFSDTALFIVCDLSFFVTSIVAALLVASNIHISHALCSDEVFAIDSDSE